MRYLLVSIMILFFLGCGSSDNLYDASRKGKVKAVQKLLTNGADSNEWTWEEDTPLHAASREGHLEIVQLLLESGANPNTHGKNDKTPIMEADNAEIAQLIRQHGGKTMDELDDIRN